MGWALMNDVGNGKSPLVAVIEDEAIVLAGYQMLLESSGYRVVAGSSTVEVLDQLRGLAEPPDFVLADFRLSGTERGTDAIAQVRARFGAGIPGMVVTGDTDVARLREAAAEGLPILHKPINGRQLLEALARSLGAAAPH